MAQPNKPECRLGLVLLNDASGSISQADWTNVLHGTAEALRSAAVKERDGLFGAVAVSGIDFAVVTGERAAWQQLETPADHERFADLYEEAANPEVGSGTDIGYAIDVARESFHLAPCNAGVRVIDVASDGQDDPQKMQVARDRFIAEGEREGFIAIINAIPLGKHGTCERGGDKAVCASAQALKENVITPNGQVYLVDEDHPLAVMMAHKVTAETAYNLPVPTTAPGDPVPPPSRLAFLALNPPQR